MASPYREFTPGAASPKLAKRPAGYRRPILSAVLHLSPADTSGYEVCGGRTRACTSGCLAFTGHGGIGVTLDDRGGLVRGNTVTAARIRRTVDLHTDPEGYVERLTLDVRKLVRYAGEVGARPVIRPNGTSDLDWRSIVGRDGTSLLDRFPRVAFYDYTKVYERMVAYLAGEFPPNYSLTYSRGETLASRLNAMRVLQAGGNVAALFNVPKAAPLPATWNGYRVIDGRAHDYRFLDPRGVVVGLSPLGRRMKGDASGFVIRDWASNP